MDRRKEPKEFLHLQSQLPKSIKFGCLSHITYTYFSSHLANIIDCDTLQFLHSDRFDAVLDEEKNAAG